MSFYSFYFFIYSGSLTPRIVLSIIIEVIVFIVTVGLAMIPTNEWPDIFFWVTMASIVILNSTYFTAYKPALNRYKNLLICSIHFNLISCGWNFPKFSVWHGRKAAIQIYGCCGVGLKCERHFYIDRLHSHQSVHIIRPNSGHLLFHRSYIRAIGLFRHIFCATIKCMYFVNSFIAPKEMLINLWFRAIFFNRDFLDIMSWWTRRNWKRPEKRAMHQMEHHIGPYSGRHFLNCSMFSSYFSSRSHCSQQFKQVSMPIK